MTANVFIASSVEGLEIAKAIQENLEHDADATIWNQGVYEPSDQVVQRLLTVLETADFGIFVFSPDDMTKLRNTKFKTVRDNVILELGLFVGRLGLERNLIITPKRSPGLHVPSDLLGLVTLDYNPSRQDENLVAALGPACNKIRRAMQKHGRVPRSTTTVAEDEKEVQTEEPLRETLWSRSMPKLELEPQSTVHELNRVLKQIRQRAGERVEQFGPSATADDIRVHVVLPDYSCCKTHGTYELFLPKRLSVGHERDDDLTLRVWPDQGVGGRAFARQDSHKVAIKVDGDGKPVWPEGYEYTERYKESLPDSLRWLVTIPLRVPKAESDTETMGVLGIQGLNHELSIDQIDTLIGYLLTDVMLVAVFIGRLSRIRLTITQEEARGGR